MCYCKIVVIIPMYNAALTICNTIKSVLLQKNVNLQILVVNHGSCDGSVALIQGISKDIHIISIERRKNEKMSASKPLNTGIRYALLEMQDYVDGNTFFLRLDSDDIFVCDTALYQLAKKYRKGIKLINGKICIYNSTKRNIVKYGVNDKYRTREQLLNGSAYAMAHHSSLISFFLLKKLIIENGFCFAENIGYGEDFDLSLRVIERCKDDEMIYCDNSIILKRVDGDTISNTMKIRTIIKDHIFIFSKHKSISKSLKISVYLWFLLEMLGGFGKAVNSKRQMPIDKYMIKETMSYKLVEEAFLLMEDKI